MIFMMIAGTYTPFCLVPLRGYWGGWSIFGVVWGGIAILGIFFKLFYIYAPRWLSTSLYVLMGGWISVIAIYPIIKNIPAGGGVFWLAGGGISYTVGAVVYATKKSQTHGRMSSVFMKSGIYLYSAAVFATLWLWSGILSGFSSYLLLNSCCLRSLSAGSFPPSQMAKSAF